MERPSPWWYKQRALTRKAGPRSSQPSRNIIHLPEGVNINLPKGIETMKRGRRESHYAMESQSGAFLDVPEQLKRTF